MIYISDNSMVSCSAVLDLEHAGGLEVGHFIGTQADQKPAPDLAVIVIIDRRVLGRETLTQALATDGRFRVRPFADIDQWELSSDRDDTDLILLEWGDVGNDQRRPETEVQALISAHPGIPVVVIGESEDSGDIAEILAQGARGYIQSRRPKKVSTAEPSRRARPHAPGAQQLQDVGRQHDAKRYPDQHSRGVDVKVLRGGQPRKCRPRSHRRGHCGLVLQSRGAVRQRPAWAVIHLRFDGARDDIGIDERRFRMGVRGRRRARRIVGYGGDQRLARDVGDRMREFGVTVSPAPWAAAGAATATQMAAMRDLMMMAAVLLRR